MKKNLFFYIIIFALCFFIIPMSLCENKIYAESFQRVEDSYKIFSEDGELLIEKEMPQIGDNFITKDLRKFEIYFIDATTRTGLAKLIGQYEVEIKETSKRFVSGKTFTGGKLGLYSTHNAESYVPTDKTDSIYGKGGIHDVGRKLRDELIKLGIYTNYDETLHLPHDTNAYSRSTVTANRLLNDGNTTIFDVHRDGVARSVYATNYNGIERSKVRIVIGKGNSKYSQNETFAVQVMAMANKLYPWLILDIYMGSGGYNQSLNSRALLFEMGTYLIEKELVLSSCAPLAEVICSVLFTEIVETPKETPIETPPENPNNNQSENPAAENPDDFIDIGYEDLNPDINLGESTLINTKLIDTYKPETVSPARIASALIFTTIFLGLLIYFMIFKLFKSERK